VAAAGRKVFVASDDIGARDRFLDWPGAHKHIHHPETSMDLREQLDTATRLERRTFLAQSSRAAAALAAGSLFGRGAFAAD
jgi:hypothetical protein